MSRPLKIALLTPVFWPEVRRGTERVVHELSTGLRASGHAPVIITSHGRGPGHSYEDGMEIVRVPRPPGRRVLRRLAEDHLGHVPFTYVALRHVRPLVSHAWYPTDALAGGRYRRRTGMPQVLSYMGIPHTSGTRIGKRLDLLRRAMEASDVTVALSRHAAAAFWSMFGYDARVIEPPVDVDTFKPGPPRAHVPTVVCAAALGVEEERKRVGLLLRAWPYVRRSRPDARLLLDDTRRGSIPSAADEGIEFAAMDDRLELARLYASAWVSVLPSRGEAFGLVLAEAMASGTPGVGASDGAVPEVIDSPRVGRLFEGDDPRDVARSILDGLELATDPATADECRKRALRLSSSRFTTAYESLYEELLRR